MDAADLRRLLERAQPRTPGICTLRRTPQLGRVRVYCGGATNSGIYVRIDPSEAPHPTMVKS